MSGPADDLLDRLYPGRVVSVTALTNGITNANYAVDLGDERVVVRVPGKDTELLGVDRAVEVDAGRLAAAVGVGPDVLAFDSLTNCIVTRFIDARPIPAEELAAEPMLGAFVASLRAVHAAGRVGAVFNPFQIARDYRDAAAARGVAAPFDLDAALALADRVEAARPFRAAVLGHNDLLNANFLFDGRVRIVDWEYAGMADPFFDLANVAVNNGFAPEAEERLLGHYFGAVDDSRRATLALMKLVSDLREAMWGVVQLAISDLDVDYAAYATDHAGRMERAAAAMDLDAALAAASA
ncbi:MAG TPA: phosphotransferase [Acidimicrobiales bacterium]|nr:phosphotransferase [Acidimicrobiales bacterium]